MERTVCEKGLCTGCNACVNSCHKNAIIVKEEEFEINAYIDNGKCVDCGICKDICPNMNEIKLNYPSTILQGWSRSASIRNNSSSGGFASTAILKCIEYGFTVFACCFINNELVYDKVKNTDDLIRFIGSKYLKSDTKKIFLDIKMELQKEKKVLFIGLPCHVAGLYAFLRKVNIENLITIDLICHGTPSQTLFRKMISENSRDESDFASFVFRKHADFSTDFDNRNGFFYWSIPFLKGQIYTENCYSCKYARIERVSDITIGDAWGSNFGAEELMKGLSLVLINSEKGKELAEMLDFNYESIDRDMAIKSNGQLDHPSKKPENRETFIKYYRESNNYFQSIKRTNLKEVFIATAKNSLVWKIGRRILRGHW